jgi:Kef-type K+ transport system membrane component KefB
LAGFEGILYLALLILFAKLFEELAVRLRQPPIIGYVLAGILLGPALLSWVQPQAEITLFIQIGVFFLFFLIGLEEIDIPGIFSALKKRLFAGAAVGFAVPFALAFLAFYALTDLELTPILAIASVIGISSLGVVAKILADYGKLKEPLGLEIFTLTAILEFIGIIVASVFIQLAQPTGFADTVNEILVPAPEGVEPAPEDDSFDYLSFAWLFARMVIFFGAVTIFGLKALPYIMQFIGKRMKVREMYFGMFIGIILLVSYFAEASGVHGAIGALLLGVMFSQMPRKDYEDTVKGVYSLAHGIFIPIFFAGIGIYFSFSFLSLPYYLIAAVLAVVTLGKFGGAILAALVAKLKPVLTVGSGVMAKGAVDLAIMLSLLSAGIVMPELFSLVVFGIVIMILATSLTLKRQMSLASSAPKEVAKEISVEAAADTVMPLYTRIALMDLRVKDVYTAMPPLISGDATIKQFVGREGMEWKPAYISVSSEGKYLGLVKQESVHRVGKSHWEDTPIAQIANPHPKTFRLEDFLYDVIEYMALHDLEMLAVVSEDGKVVGGIMRKDVLRYISR